MAATQNSLNVKTMGSLLTMLGSEHNHAAPLLHSYIVSCTSFKNQAVKDPNISISLASRS